MPERFAHYEIREKIGQGGMGAVYLARDTRLQRDVAVKVLPEAFLQDPERLARFQREAQLLAQLSHPHVAQIYGFEEADGQRFLTMEYVAGEDLAVRLTRGRIPVDETVKIARQIAEALEAAHEAGIVHRDLKPSNVRLTPDDGVKVLDFGLAKALEGDPGQSSTDLSISPTITGMMTSANVILGTAAYMSPEQARGKRVDRRADIWAFGAVLYEMLTGKQAFHGETVSDVLASVLKTEPDRDALPQDTPPALRRLVDRCLEKDPRTRLRDIGEARILLSGPLEEAVEAAPLSTSPQRSPLPWIAAVVLVAALAGATAWFLKPVPKPGVLQFDLEVPEGTLVRPWNTQAVSPDGTMIVYSATDTARVWNLYLRTLGESGSRLLEGTREAIFPFWSPDSRQVAYAGSSDNHLFRIAVDGGAPVPICVVTSMRGGTWNKDGVIVFAPESAGPLYRVPAMGGTPVAVTQVDTTAGDSHRWPWFLPDGDRFLYLDAYGPDGGRVRVGSLSDPGPGKEILQIDGNAAYDGGYLFFVRDHILHAQEFDPAKLTLGEIQVVTNGVGNVSNVSMDAFSVGSGVIAYLDAPADQRSEGGVVEYDGSGKVVRTYELGGRTDDLCVVPDGSRLAVMVAGQTTANDVWVLDTDRDVKTRVSFDGASDDPALSPDGREVVYAASGNIVRRRVDAAGEPEMLLRDNRDKVLHQWTSAGEIIYCTAGNRETLCRLNLETGEDVVLRSGQFRYMLGQVSPDGKWIAYVCDETGDLGVYVEDYPGLTTRVRISREPGTFPRWTRGGSRLWYMDSSHDLHEVSLSVAGGTMRVVADEVRFPVPQESWASRTHQIGVSDDGTRIFALSSEGSATGAHVFRVIHGWRAGD